MVQDRINTGNIKISFVQKDAPGWILIYVKAEKNEKEIWASYCFPPFEKLVRFVEDILENNLPSYVTVDMEGLFMYFEALPHERENLFHFILRDSCTRESCAHIPIDGIFERKQFVTEFLEKFEEFLSTEYDDVLWDGGDLRSIDLSRLKMIKVK